MAIREVLTNKLFAEYKETIKQLYLIDDDFQALCDDFCLSIVNIEKLKKESLIDSLRTNEYEDLSRDLENEILQYILNVR